MNFTRNLSLAVSNGFHYHRALYTVVRYCLRIKRVYSAMNTRYPGTRGHNCLDRTAHPTGLDCGIIHRTSAAIIG